MIERWPVEWPVTFPSSEFKIFNDLDSLNTEEIEALFRARAMIAEDATNAQRLRHARALFMLNEEMAMRSKAHEKSQERDAPVEADSAMTRRAAGFGLLRRINHWKSEESFRHQSAATPQILLHKSHTGKKWWI